MSTGRTVTGWLAGTERPVRIGAYQRKGPGKIMCSLYDGHQWCFSAETPERAAQFADAPSHNQDLPWRGLTAERAS